MRASRVLSGRISRGVADRINAVIWYSDLRGYTKITDTAAPDEIIPLLNDYAAAVIAAVRVAGGEVLKLIGDGVLAIFRADDARASVPLRAARGSEPEVRRQGGERALEPRAIIRSPRSTSGCISARCSTATSAARIDSTSRSSGPAVNEASRIAAMCRSVDRSVVMSSEFAAATPEPERANLVSVGRFALARRGPRARSCSRSIRNWVPTRSHRPAGQFRKRHRSDEPRTLSSDGNWPGHGRCEDVSSQRSLPGRGGGDAVGDGDEVRLHGIHVRQRHRIRPPLRRRALPAQFGNWPAMTNLNIA